MLGNPGFQAIAAVFPLPPSGSIVPNIAARPLNGVARYLRRIGLISAERKLSRDQYKAVWNSVSASENDAKMAVSGYIDEETYASTGNSTLTMLEALVGVRETDVILEIGAGVGRVGAVLAPRCKQWIGCDVSENMVSHIKRRLAHFSNVRAVAISGYDLGPIESSSVDLVYCTVVFMHLDEWDRYNYVAEAFRVLRPGGRLLVDNFNLASDDGWTLFESHRAIPPSQRPTQISKSSTPEELITYLTRAGFGEIKTHFANLWVIAYGVKPA